MHLTSRLTEFSLVMVCTITSSRHDFSTKWRVCIWSQTGLNIPASLSKYKPCQEKLRFSQELESLPLPTFENLVICEGEFLAFVANQCYEAFGIGWWYEQGGVGKHGKRCAHVR